MIKLEGVFVETVSSALSNLTDARSTLMVLILLHPKYDSYLDRIREIGDSLADVVRDVAKDIGKELEAED